MPIAEHEMSKTALQTHRKEVEDVRKANNGDESAYERLYILHRQQIFSLCLRLTKNVADAEDVSQQVFLQAYLKLHTFRGDCSFGGWLYKIATNECLLHIRKRHHDVPLEHIPYHHSWFDSGNYAAATICGVCVSQLMDALPEYPRVLLLLRHVAGFTQRELTDWLRLPLGTTKAQLSRARKAARRVLHPPQRAKSNRNVETHLSAAA